MTNFGGASYGRLTLRDATAKSVNTAYAELNIEVGPKATQDMAEIEGVHGVSGLK